MPIKPPNLDDRRYADIVRESRALIPQYCPEWTNLSDADPGMTVVQLFAWMTEMTIYRLNRVPDKTYVHFLNFIGEERRDARPSSVPLTFTPTPAQPVVHVPPFTRCSTRQSGGQEALHFVTVDAITVHSALVERVVAAHAGESPTVREIPFERQPELPQIVSFAQGRGVQPFKMDPVEHGPNAYTPYHYLYLSHDDFRLMDFPRDSVQQPGRIRLRTATEENLPIAGLFRWERYTHDQWVPMELVEEEEEVLGVPEVSLLAHLPHPSEVEQFGHEADPFVIPEVVGEERRWIRGVVDYDRWLANRMQDDLELTWRDDRGGEERLITNWDVRATGRNLEFFIQDMPPIRPGWTVRFTLVDRSMPFGRTSYFPKFRFSYRKGDTWETVAPERVRYQGTSILLTGPFADMASDGYNLRAERLEAASLQAMMPNLEIEATWLRPVVLHLAAGPETAAAGSLDPVSMPCQPFQPATTLPPLAGMKFFIGADVFDNRSQRPVMLELEVGFELDGDLIEEPKDDYHLQLTYRAADTWRVVHTEDAKYARFTFSTLDPDGALQATRRRLRIFLDPKENLKGLFRSEIAGTETCWLRLELTRAALSRQPDRSTPPVPIHLRVFAVRIGVDGVIGKTIYEQPMPGLKVATVEHRQHNRRMSRALVRASGRLSEHYPFDTFVDLSDDGPTDDPTTHTALYLKLSKPLPVGVRHAITFRARGETYLPQGVAVLWEELEHVGPGRVRWRRLLGSDQEDNAFKLDRTGALAFEYPTPAVPSARDGVWLRVLFRTPKGADLPALPPLTHIMLNTVDGVNLHEFRMEKFSGQGIPHQSVKLRRQPLFLHSEEERESQFTNPDQFPDLRVYIVEDDGERREWRKAAGNTLLTSTKDDRVFVVDPVEGTLTFGNGIRGKIPPVGNYNIAVELYHVVPGEAGNVGAGKVTVCEAYNDVLAVNNALPANGGRNAESIDEILRRAPSVLASRDRAVTRADFEIIAKEASGEVARAACDGKMSVDGEVEVVVLPRRLESELVPDPFLSTGLKEHVQKYLAKRCLVNVTPRVRLATFQAVDVSLSVRMRQNANFVLVRERARQWVRDFLDPYVGGLDKQGWPFKSTLFSQDFGRIVSEIEEVRHVVEVSVYPVELDPREPAPGWERGQGRTTLTLDAHDLFVLRNVRVISEDGEA